MFIYGFDHNKDVWWKREVRDFTVLWLRDPTSVCEVEWVPGEMWILCPGLWHLCVQNGNTLIEKSAALLKWEPLSCPLKTALQGAEGSIRWVSPKVLASSCIAVAWPGTRCLPGNSMLVHGDTTSTGMPPLHIYYVPSGVVFHPEWKQVRAWHAGQSSW